MKYIYTFFVVVVAVAAIAQHCGNCKSRLLSTSYCALLQQPNLFNVNSAVTSFFILLSYAFKLQSIEQYIMICLYVANVIFTHCPLWFAWVDFFSSQTQNRLFVCVLCVCFFFQSALSILVPLNASSKKKKKNIVHKWQNQTSFNLPNVFLFCALTQTNLIFALQTAVVYDCTLMVNRSNQTSNRISFQTH